MKALLSALRKQLGEGGVLTDPPARAAYSMDALTAVRTRPQAVLLPQTQAQVVEAVRLLHQAGVPFVPRGSGTSLSGGAAPVEGGVVLALHRLNRILKISPDDRTARVESGVANLKVSDAAAPYGLYYAPDPSSQSTCTIGGNLAYNSGGAHCLKYGMTANHVLGLKAVLADGTLVELGGGHEPVGPDLVGFFIGHEGTFGVVLEATLRLLPRPEAYHTLLAAYPSLESAGDAVARIIKAGLLPGAMEIMDRLAIQAVEAAGDTRYPQGAAAVLIVELEGTRHEVSAEARALEEVIDVTGAFAVRVARNDKERAAIWRGRKGAFSAVGRLSPDYLVQDGVVPRSRLGQALTEIERLAQNYGLRVANVFHAGDGNLHPLILYDAREPGAFDRAEALAAEILRMCIRLGGVITGEHGVGVEKRGFLPEQFSDTEIDLMKRVRKAMDPKGLANPGKVFP